MDVLIYLPFAVLLLFYFIFFFFKKRINLPNHFVYWVRKMHYVVLFILVFLMMMSMLGFYIQGVWTNEILMWILLLTQLTMQLKIDFLKSKIEKVYFKVLLFSPILLVVSWIIPMFGLVVSASFMLMFNTFEDRIIYNDNQFKISFNEWTLYDIEFDLYEKRGLFEKKIKTLSRDDIDFEKINYVKPVKKDEIKIDYVQYSTLIKKDTILRFK